jgi:tRNA A-37 threonylcarbamoyl transferase component Bud32
MDRELCRFTIAGISWRASDADRDSVTEATKALQQGGELVRVTLHRRVLRVGGRRPLIVKQFSPRGIAAHLKAFIRPNPAMREWMALSKAARLALPVPRPVAVGWRHTGLMRESFLVMEAMEDTRPLSSCLFGKHKLAVRPRREVTRAAALVIRRMHDAGIFHKDLHLDNLMVRTGDVSPAVYLIDFQRVAFYRSLNTELRMSNLATLHGGCIEAARADRLRFLKTYLGHRSAAPGDLRRLMARLDEMGKRHRRRVWRSRRRRCLAENRDFKKVRLGSFVGMVRQNQHEAFEALWQEPAHCFSRATIVASSAASTLGRIDLGNRAVYIARYSNSGFLHGVTRFCAPSRAQRDWLTGDSCMMRGVPIATPLAYLEQRRWGFLVESYIISECEKGEDLVQTWVRCAGDIGAKCRLIDDFARYIARMHDRDVAIREFTGKDIIVSGKNPPFGFSIVDFSGATIGPLSRRRRIEHLHALARAFCHADFISKTDRLRFLRTYLGGDFKREWKTFGRDLQI